MSWSVSTSGSKDEVKAAVVAQLDQQAQPYAGTSEEDDIVAAKGRILALIDEVDTSPAAEGQPDRLVSVSAFGSHSTVDGKLSSASISISISRSG